MFLRNHQNSLKTLLWTRRLLVHEHCEASPRCIATTAAKLHKIQVVLDDKLERQLEAEEVKPRQHYGVNKNVAVWIPEKIQRAMIKAIGDFPVKALTDGGSQFNRYIQCRKAPIEESNLVQKVKEIEDMVLSDPAKFKLPKLPDASDEAASKLFYSRKNQVVKSIVKQRIYHWQPIVYDDYKALEYLVGRSALEYTVIMRIFKEIIKRDPDFAPNSYFDFGSGVGTGIWAASELWKSSIYEYYLVDTSKHMNELSDRILRDGNENKAMTLRNVYYRQFLPARVSKYDIVLSAYTMFEMPSLKNRLETAHKLWDKTQQYLIFIEVGTMAGYSILNEIRSYLMAVNETSKEDAFIFSPCPHEGPCPRYELNDGTPCNFDIIYNPLKFSENMSPKKSTYSYLVIRKGKAIESDRWPRIVRSTMLRHKHVVCRVCNAGRIQDAIITKSKHGKWSYRCAKSSNWGDQLPMKIIEPEMSEYEHSDGSDGESSDEEKEHK